MGKPVGEALFNAKEAAALVRFYAEAVDKSAGDVYRVTATVSLHNGGCHGTRSSHRAVELPTFNAALKLAPALRG